MVFKAEKTVSIPNKDLISWTFDDNKFEQDEPVSHFLFLVMTESFERISRRFFPIDCPD